MGPLAEELTELFARRGSVGLQQPFDRERFEPGRLDGDRERVVGPRLTHDGASRRYEDPFTACEATLDVDGLINDLARYELGPLTDADAVLADFL